MADNQAAQQGEGGAIARLRAAISGSPASEPGVIESSLRKLGVDRSSVFVNADSPMTQEQRDQAFAANTARMGMEYYAARPEAGPFTALMDMSLGPWAPSSTARETDVDPLALRTAVVQQAAESVLGETAGSFIGGMSAALANAQKLPGQLVNMASRWWNDGEDMFSEQRNLTPEQRRFWTGYTTRDALEQDVITNRGATVSAAASPTERAAAMGATSETALMAGQITGDVGLMIASWMVPGAGPVKTAETAGRVGKMLGAVRAYAASPGGSMYLGFVGGRSSFDMSRGFNETLRFQHQAADSFNAAVTRLKLPFDRIEKDRYSVLMDAGTSIAAGVAEIAIESISAGIAGRLGVRPILDRAILGKADIATGGMASVWRASLGSAAATGGAEGLEEVAAVYKDALLRGLWSPYEEGRFLKTFDPGDLVKTLKQHGREALIAGSIGFIIGAPLGAAGGRARWKAASPQVKAFQRAVMADAIAAQEGASSEHMTDLFISRYLSEVAMDGRANPDVMRVIGKHLRERSMPDIGNVTESQMQDPEWVRQFARSNPLLAVAIAENRSELSRTDVEWMTGPASKGKVPGREARQRFLETLKAETREMVPEVMRGFLQRSASRLEVLRREYVDGLRRGGAEGRARAIAAATEIGYIRQTQEVIGIAIAEGKMFDLRQFPEWQQVELGINAADLDGTADAEQDSPHTAATASPEIKDLLARARKNDAEAAFELAQRYEQGDGVEAHPSKAEYWLNVALAQADDPQSLLWLGKFFEGRLSDGRPGLPKSINKARVLYRRAYELGSDEAGQLLGDMETRLYGGPAVPRPGRIDAAEASQAARRPQAAPAASVAQPASATPQEAPAAPAASPAVSEAPSVAPVAQQPESAPVEADPAADTRRAVEARVAVEQRMQAEEQARAEAERAEAERRAADEADAPRREIERQVQQGAEDPGLRVRFVEAATPVEEKIAKAAGKLGKRVQFIRIFRDEAREGNRRRRTPSGIRGFVGSDANTIYLVQVPNVMREQATTAYYLQTLAHENAHGVIRESDAETLKRVDALAGRALIAEFERRFDLGEGAERVEEIRVQTLTTGVVDAAGLDAILLADTAVEKTIARLKLLFNGLKIALTGNERAALLKRLTQEQVARAKAAKEAKPTPTPAPAAAEPAATRAAKPEPAAKPKPATQPTDDLARLIKDGQWVIGVTLEQGDQIQVVADGETVVLDSTSKAKGIDLRIIGKKLYLLRGSTTAVVTSAKVLTKPSVGKAKPKAAQPQAAQATAEPAPKVDPANEPVASELPKPRRGRGKKGDGQQAMFMREISDSTLPTEAKSAIKRGHLMFMRAWHGSNSEHAIEVFDPDRIGRIAYGWGLYASADKATAIGYARHNGRLYQVEYDESLLIDLDADVSEQMPEIRDAFLEIAAEIGMTSFRLRETSYANDYRSRSGDILQHRASEAIHAMATVVAFNARFGDSRSGDARMIQSARAVSMMLLARGINGGRFADYRTSGPPYTKTDFYNYVFFSPELVRISMVERMPEQLADWKKVYEQAADNADRGVAFMRERTDAIDTAYMKAVERGQSVAARKHLDAAAEAMGFERAFRFIVQTPAGERGLINREAWDDRHLTERQILELPELLDLGMQQPARGTTGTFYFTSDGLKNHAKLIRWLSNAATGEVIRRSVYFNDANWESFDGQVALETGQYVSARLVVRDGDGNVIPPSRRFAGAQNESTNDTRFMRERNSPKDRQRIAELNAVTDLFDERSFGELSHPTDGEDVDAEGIIIDMLMYSAKVPRKYLKGVEEFEYLAAAIHHVLIEKSADSTDYERAAAVMMRALDEGIADYDQIVVAARRMGFEGTDKTVPFDIVSEEDVDPLRLNELMDDPDGFGGDIRFMRERTDAAIKSLKSTFGRTNPDNAAMVTAFAWQYQVLRGAINDLREEGMILPDSDAADELFQLAGRLRNEDMRQFAMQETMPFEDMAKALAKDLNATPDEVLDLVQEYAFMVRTQEIFEILRVRKADEIDRKVEAARRSAAEMGEFEVDPNEIHQRISEEVAAIGLTPDKALARQREIEKHFAKDARWIEMVRRLRAMSRKTLEMHREAGTIPEPVYQSLVQSSPNYVPVVTSIFSSDVAQPDAPKRAGSRVNRSLVAGQLDNSGELRRFWMASYELTKSDRLKAADRRHRNRGHNAMGRLAEGDVLRWGGQSLLTPVSFEDEMNKAARIEAIRMKDATNEDGSPLTEEQKAARLAAARTRARENLEKEILGVGGAPPTIARYHLEEDRDMTPPEAFAERDEILASEDGLSNTERERNVLTGRRIAEMEAYRDSAEWAKQRAGLEKILKELISEERFLLSQKNPDMDQVAIIREQIQGTRSRISAPNRSISALKSKIVKPRVTESMTAEQAKAAKEEAAKKLVESKRKVVPKGTVMHYRINEPALADAMLSREKGMLAKAIEGESGKAAEMAARAWVGVMSMLRAAYVSLSPGFSIGEIMRSPNQAAVMIGVIADEWELSPEQAKRLAEAYSRMSGGNNVPIRAIAGFQRASPWLSWRWRSVRRAILNRPWKGGKFTEYEQLVVQAIEDGVFQGNLMEMASDEKRIAQLKQRMKQLERLSTRPGLLRKWWGKTKGGAKFVSDGFEMAQTGIDMVNRMNVYAAALEAGLSRQKAAILASEATIDFGKKGKRAARLGQFYLFFAPRMQGIHQLLRAGKTQGGRRGLAALFFWSFLLSVLKELIWEDDEDPQTQASKFASLQSMLVPIPGLDNDLGQQVLFEIRNPYGFGVASKFGTRLADWMFGDVGIGGLVSGVASDVVSEASPLAIDLSEPGQWIPQLTPTAIQPWVSAAMNTDWKGAPIAPIGASFGPGDPRNSQKYFANTPEPYIWAANLIADVTGAIARSVTPGARGWEVSPNTVGYIVERYMPGVAKDALNVFRSGQASTIDRIPLLGSLVTQTGGQQAIPGMYRDLMRQRMNMKSDIKEGLSSDVIRSRYADLIQWGGASALDSTERQVQRLREARNDAVERGDSDTANRMNERMLEIQANILRGWMRYQNRNPGIGNLDNMIQRVLN